MAKTFTISLSEGHIAEIFDSLNELADLLECDEERINDLHEVADLIFTEAREQGYLTD